MSVIIERCVTLERCATIERCATLERCVIIERWKIGTCVRREKLATTTISVLKGPFGKAHASKIAITSFKKGRGTDTINIHDPRLTLAAKAKSVQIRIKVPRNPA
jgi:hypothetical protein